MKVALTMAREAAMEHRYALRDDQWERIEAMGLPGCKGHVGCDRT